MGAACGADRLAATRDRRVSALAARQRGGRRSGAARREQLLLRHPPRVRFAASRGEAAARALDRRLRAAIPAALPHARRPGRARTPRRFQERALRFPRALVLRRAAVHLRYCVPPLRADRRDAVALARGLRKYSTWNLFTFSLWHFRLGQKAVVPSFRETK